MEIKSKDDRKLDKKGFKKLLKTKKSRIILRNVSFKVNEDIIRDEFKQFGPIVDINIPKKADGRMIGFCFVGFDSIKSALKAIKEMNGKELLGRTIAVDFALAKKKFQTQTQTDNQVEDNDGPSGGEPEQEDDRQNGDETIESDQLAEEDGDESEKDEAYESELDDTEMSDDRNAKRRVDPKLMNDASEERTVFVRNLPFLTVEEDLNELMSKFGPTFYSKICVDPMTEHSKGTAFVKFKSKEDANKCIEASEDNSDELYLDGRQLKVSLAVTKSKLKTIEESRSMKDKDKRNLYLAKEGLIYPNSPAAEGVSQTDLSKRLSLETRKRKMLQNNHYFVSKTRLCVHNLPENCDNKRLKTIFSKAVNDKSAKIIEARVMYNRRKSDLKMGKSKGFGFVDFSEHIHALKALRNLNNNPNIFTNQKRPIVEFSIENKVALNKKKKRIESSEEMRKKKEISESNQEEEEGEGGDASYSGVHSKPNKPNDKIKAPKVNRKLNEMQKQLKSRKKKIKMERTREDNEKRHKQKMEKRKANKRDVNDIQDSHDLHYKKRKNVFKDNDSKTVPVVKKKAKWFSE